MTLLRFLLMALSLALLVFQLSTGERVNVETGEQFFVREVRGWKFDWYNWVGVSLIVVFAFFAMRFISVSERFFQNTFFSLYFFNRTKLWIRGLLPLALRNFSAKLGIICYQVFLVETIEPLRFSLKMLKTYVNGVQISN